MFMIVRPTVKKGSSMGMLKSGAYNPPSSSTWVDVTSMVVDSSYPMTVLSSDKLIADGSINANFSASVNWTGGLATKQIGVTVNGVLVWQMSSGSVSSVVSSGTFTWGLRSNDVVGLQVNCSNITSSRGSIAASNTFLRWTA